MKLPEDSLKTDQLVQSRQSCSLDSCSTVKALLPAMHTLISIHKQEAAAQVCASTFCSEGVRMDL